MWSKVLVLPLDHFCPSSRFKNLCVYAMPYHRNVGYGSYRRRFLSAAVGAAGAAAGRKVVSMAKRAGGYIRRRFKRSAPAVRRRYSRRTSRKFLRSMKIGPNRVVTCVHRGSVKIHQTVTPTFVGNVCKWDLSSPRSPADTGDTAWDTTATGFNHMCSMYHQWRVLGSKLRVTIRPAKVITLGSGTSGTTTNATWNAPSIKLGLMQIDAMGPWPITDWLSAKMLDFPVTTWNPSLEEGGRRSVTLVSKYSPSKWSGVKPGETFDSYNGTPTTEPSKYVHAHLWMQSSDKETTCNLSDWEVSWELEFRVKFWDFHAIESDMTQGVRPS